MDELGLETAPTFPDRVYVESTNVCNLDCIMCPTGRKEQVLMGVTGSGKTFTMAKVIEAVNRPTLVLSHNKTLAAQLYQEFRRFFPENAVEYFVSYYDYYQPEAYIARSDTYIEKDSSRNDEIDRLRHAATHALFERRDVIIVASVSCIYGLGTPQEYVDRMLRLKVGEEHDRDSILRRLVEIQYTRNDMAFTRGTFRVRGDTLEVFPVYEEHAVRIEFFGDEIDSLRAFDPADQRTVKPADGVVLLPASEFLLPAGGANAIREGLGKAAARLPERLAADLARFEGDRAQSGATTTRALHAGDAAEVWAAQLSPATGLDHLPPGTLLVVTPETPSPMTIEVTPVPQPQPEIVPYVAPVRVPKPYRN